MASAASPSQKIVLFMRGLPGSGKSTYARAVKKTKKAEGKSVVIYSTDDFFMVDGTFVFNGDRLMEFHDMNFERFKGAVHDLVDLIIVDNTNLKLSDYERYIVFAKGAGYATFEKMIGGFNDESVDLYSRRGKVPQAVVAFMARNYLKSQNDSNL